ncbi:MAG: guanylate kinase [Synergistaceae bacterium]|nr:guanylate kinase [Synergistaceae bacterium]
MKDRGSLFILSGPAGAGKGTLRKELFKEEPDLTYSVSCTTRSVRQGEVEGKDYHFVTRESFKALIVEEAFLEWAEVHGNYYGTRKSDVEASLDRGEDLVLEIDVQGCLSVKNMIPDAVPVFITVRSLDELEKRLRGRGTETEEQMALRLRNAAMEMSFSDKYEHIIINDDLIEATRELVEIVRSYRSLKHPRGE